EDIKTIFYYIGKVVFAISILMIFPLIVSLISREWSPALNITASMFFGASIGLLLDILCKTKRELNWGHGLAVAALSWLAAMFIGALPLFLSGHFASYLDACFDAMSGFATTGLALISDVDHLSDGINMWRHFIMFLGGQGIIVVGLTFLLRGTAGTYRMYVGEARDEKIMPNVVQTARFIWIVSLVYLVIGTLSLFFAGLLEGMPAGRSFFHGMWMFMAAFDTGGFTPQSQSILYYHSPMIETIIAALMVLGTINFALHFAIWNRNTKELTKNIEIRALLASIFAIFVLAIIGLKQFGSYPHFLSMFRKGFFQILSAHSGTGFMTISSGQFVSDWGPLGMLAVTFAMAFGGSACSTCGGIKALRIGIFFKALIQDIKKLITPGTAIISQKFHHIKDSFLEDRFVRSVFIIILSYIITYVIGTIVGMIYGFSLYESLFESVSAAANVGLSCGITSPSMPTVMKVVYIIQMWVGRLEFMSIFALIGLIVAGIKR
ncbi:TrkH family potassium uptake protein, partial [Candidatus Margulisiibacteriota bacterium]